MYLIISFGQYLVKLAKVSNGTGQCSATFRDKGTEVPSLSWDKGTMGLAQNLAKGRAGTACQDLGWDVVWDGTRF